MKSRCKKRIASSDENLPEPLHVNEEGEDSHGGGDTTEHGPESDPELREGALVLVEVVTVARHGAVGLVAGRQAVEVRRGRVGDRDERVPAVAGAVPLRRPAYPSAAAARR